MVPSRLVLNWVLKHKIYLFNMYLLSFYSVTSAVLDGRGKRETKTERPRLNVQRQFFMNVLHFCLSYEQRH